MSRMLSVLKRLEAERHWRLNQPDHSRPPRWITELLTTSAATSPGDNQADIAIAQEGPLSQCREEHWQPKPGGMLQFTSDQGCPGAEIFRKLRAKLDQLRRQQTLKVLLVSSPLAGEGKTFVAANLAQALAQQGRRTLLIDADLRRPTIHSLLQAPPNPGISDHLQDGAELAACLQKGPGNLFFAPAGRATTNPADLLANGKLQAMIGALRDEFDWLILDSPPALIVSDAAQIAEVCDGVLVVLRAEKTGYKLAQNICHTFGDKVVGIVLNRAARELCFDAYDYGYAYAKPTAARQAKV